MIDPWSARFAIRCIYAAFFLLYGMLLLPGQTFGHGNIYVLMAEVAPQLVWSAWFLYLGCMGIWGLTRSLDLNAGPHIIEFASLIAGTATMIYMTVTPFISAYNRGFIPAAVSDYVVMSCAFCWCAASMPWPFRSGNGKGAARAT